MSSLLDLISITEFKQRFNRKFTNYTPYQAWNDSTNYLTGDFVFDIITLDVYEALQDNVNKNPPDNPSEWELKTAIDIKDKINHLDLENAMNYAEGNIAFSLRTDGDRKQGGYLLMAHYLQLKINEYSKTHNSLGAVQSKSFDVGSISYADIPEELNTLSSNNLTRTEYGIEYLSFVKTRFATPFLHIH